MGGAAHLPAPACPSALPSGCLAPLLTWVGSWQSALRLARSPHLVAASLVDICPSACCLAGAWALRGALLDRQAAARCG
eukprot:7488385-Alexandrium_andersonii.AAC.1